MQAPSSRPDGGRRRLPAAPARLTAARKDSATDIEPYDVAEPEADAATRAAATGAEIVRWGAFSCVLAPCTLLTCGYPTGAVLGTAVGLSVVTVACRMLLRQSERAHIQQTYTRLSIERPGPHRGRHSRTGTGLHRGGRHPGVPGQP